MLLCRLAIIACAIGLITGLGPGPARAATGDIGYHDQSFNGAGTAPSGSKPESKLWWNDGAWWASMWDTASGDFHIFRLDLLTQRWQDTGVAIDGRPDTRADALWDGTHLYVASHVFSESPANGFPSRLYRFSYSPLTRIYSLDAGFPVSINNYKTETLVIDKDSTGKLWATWTQGSQVYANRTTTSDKNWGTPFVLPVTGASRLSNDDISAVVAFGGNKIGVMWSNQKDSAVYFAVHADGQPDTTWQQSRTAIAGPNYADDHINLKSLQADGGRVFAAVKTSLNDLPHPNPNMPLVMLLARDPATGNWSSAVFGRISDDHTRSIVIVDETNRVLHMFATAPVTGGAIYEKTSPLSSISFPIGLGTPVIRDAATPNVNNVTSTKQNVNSTTGLVVLATNDGSSGSYWHGYEPIQVPTPVADFSASPTSGTAPLAVSFTDSSSGSPTSWSWDFGDGGSSTAQSPTHTYTSAGTYTVALTATNAGGSDTKTRTNYVSAHDPVVAAAGDIACPPGSPVTATTCQQQGTSDLLVGGGYDAVLPLGDNQYDNGELANYQLIFDPTWGRVKTIMHPTPGNHEYQTPGAAGYFDYFGSLAGPSGPGYYSFDLGSWHVVSLNSEIAMGVGSAQETWLKNDLAAHPSQCTLAFWHQPLFSSDSVYGPGIKAVRPLYDDLYYAGADLVLNGHAHDYERFVTQDPYGNADPTHGMRAFVVGTGGAEQRPLGTRLANSVVFSSTSFGILRLTLHSEAYDWDFVPAAGSTFHDSGSSSCTGTPPFPPGAPVADFSATPTSGTAPLAVSFSDTSTGLPSTWSWNFGDGTSSTAQSPTHTYTSAGTYTVSLLAANAGGSDTKTKVGYVTVNPQPPVADFSGTPTGGSAPLTVKFSDRSTNNPTTWSWDFGDAGTSTAQDPSYTYASAGTYTVSLTASNAGGSNTKTLVGYVVVSAPVASYQTEVLADSPISYWRLGETTGTTAADSTGSNPGSIKSGVTLGATGALSGDTNTAMTFNGSTGYVSMADSASLNMTGDLTVEAWAKPGSLDSITRAIIHKGGTSGYGSYQYRIGLTSSNFWRGTVYIGSTNYTVTSSSVATSAAWTYLAMTRSGSTLKLYVNGVAVATATASGALNASSGNLAIGRTGATSVDYFKGSIDEVAVYPAALSSTRIAAHYRAGTGG